MSSSFNHEIQNETVDDSAPLKELFLVEGKSAASTIRQAMDGSSQEVFALQGKMLNIQTLSQSKVESNEVCAELFALLGCGIGEQCDPSKLSFARVILLTDPDVDGAHARALLAILFARFLSPLVASGQVFAVIPPLWRLGASSDGQPMYAWTDDELTELRAKNLDSQPASASVDTTTHNELTRFKGVAQFNRDECVELLLNPHTRRHVRLSLGND